MRTKDKIVIAVAVLVGACFLATGLVDIDWMVTTFYFDMYNGSSGFWEFCPGVSVGWWIAYFVSIVRVVLGAGLLGFGIGQLKKAE